MFLQLHLALLALGFAACQEEPDDSWPPQGNHIELIDGLGTLTFPVGVAEGVQRYVDQGFRLVAAFDFHRAVLSFRAAQNLDPTCAMCVWGEALALGPNLNTFDEPRLVASVPLAYQRAEVASDLCKSSRCSAKDMALVQALGARYAPTTETYLLQEAELTQKYARAMEQVYADFGPSANLAALAADAWMNTHPWDYWLEPGVPREETKLSVKALKLALRDAPDHPFCVHLYIHVGEASGDRHFLRDILPYAQRLPELMPAAPHTVHMAFHAMMHSGDYRTSDIDNARASNLPRQVYPMHNLDTLTWVCRMEGRSKCALRASLRLEKMALLRFQRGLFETGFPAVRFVVQHILTLLSFNRVHDILRKQAPLNCSEAFSCGIWHFARGSAQAELGNPWGAREALRALTSQRSAVLAAEAARPEWA